MRKTIFLFALLAGTLSLQAQNYPLRARLSDPNSFSVIVIPDPQSYTKFAANQPLFELQTAWIAREIDSLRILTALCTGDLVEQNETAIPLAFRKTRPAPSSGGPRRALSSGSTTSCPTSSARATTTTDTPSRRTACRASPTTSR